MRVSSVECRVSRAAEAKVSAGDKKGLVGWLVEAARAQQGDEMRDQRGCDPEQAHGVGNPAASSHAIAASRLQHAPSKQYSSQGGGETPRKRISDDGPFKGLSGDL